MPSAVADNEMETQDNAASLETPDISNLSKSEKKRRIDGQQPQSLASEDKNEEWMEIEERSNTEHVQMIASIEEDRVPGKEKATEEEKVMDEKNDGAEKEDQERHQDNGIEKGKVAREAGERERSQIVNDSKDLLEQIQSQSSKRKTKMKMLGFYRGSPSTPLPALWDLSSLLLISCLGEIPSAPQGNFIDHIHENWFYNYNLLEDHHSYIQWIFPTFEESMVNDAAPPLGKAEAKIIRGDLQCAFKVNRSTL